VKGISRIFIYAVAAPLMAIPFVGCEVEQTQEGQLPAYDVDPAEVEFGTEEVDVKVPDVDVDMEEREITVPDVDINMPDDDNDTLDENDDDDLVQ
jgi:hypothetical protein